MAITMPGAGGTLTRPTGTTATSLASSATGFVPSQPKGTIFDSKPVAENVTLCSPTLTRVCVGTGAGAAPSTEACAPKASAESATSQPLARSTKSSATRSPLLRSWVFDSVS